jgi:Cu/Ag efflux protein CusF
MFRYVFGGALALALAAGPAPAADGKPQVLRGTIKKADAKKNLLTVTVKGQDKDVEVKVTEDTVFMAGPRKQYKGKEGLKADAFKAGTVVVVLLGPKGAAQRVMAAPGSFRPPDGVGPGKPTPGTVKKVDAAKGVVTVTVKDKGKDKDLEIKVGDNTRLTVPPGPQGGPKQYKGKEGLKDKAFQSGSQVMVMFGPKGEAVMITAMPSAPMMPQYTPTRGTVKKVDAKKGVLTLTARGKDVEVKVGDDTRFVVGGPKGHKEYKGKDGLKADAFKSGTQVVVMLGPKGHAQMIMAMSPDGGSPESGRPAHGAVKKVDAEKGVLTLTVQEGGKEKNVDFKVTGATRFLVPGPRGEKKEYKGKEGLKADAFKAGAHVVVFADDKGEARMVLKPALPPMPPQKQPADKK